MGAIGLAPSSRWGIGTTSLHAGFSAYNTSGPVNHITVWSEGRIMSSVGDTKFQWGNGKCGYVWVPLPSLQLTSQDNGASGYDFTQVVGNLGILFLTTLSNQHETHSTPRCLNSVTTFWSQRWDASLFAPYPTRVKRIPESCFKAVKSFSDMHMWQ